MAKKQSGGQPGNRNAHRHGFYAAALTRHQQGILRRASKIDAGELTQEIALLRSRIHQLVNNEPDNLTVLNMTMRTLVRLIALNHGLSDTQTNAIHESLRDLIQTVSPAFGGAA